MLLAVARALKQRQRSRRRIDHLRGRRGRRRPRRSARDEAAVRRDDERADRSVRLAIDGTGLFLINVGRRQPSLSRDVQGTGRPQLRRVRHGEPDSGDGTGHREDLAARAVPARPIRTTFNVGRVGGGTSVNAIPSECWMEVDLRSTDAAARSPLSTPACSGPWTKPCAKRTSAAASAARSPSSGNSSATVRRGRHPRSPRSCAPRLPPPGPRHHPTPTESSTDANVPIQLKIPAITIGTGGRGHRYAYGRGDLRHDRRVEGDPVRGARCDRARSAVKGRAGRWAGRSGGAGGRPAAAPNRPAACPSIP